MCDFWGAPFTHLRIQQLEISEKKLRSALNFKRICHCPHEFARTRR
jgi:hypothetical protein